MQSLGSRFRGNDGLGRDDGLGWDDGFVRGLWMLIVLPLGVLIVGRQELTLAGAVTTGEPHAVAGFPLSRESRFGAG